MDNLNQKKAKLEPITATRNHLFNVVFQLEFSKLKNADSILQNYYALIEEEIISELEKDKNFTIYTINKNILEEKLQGIIKNISKIDAIIKSRAIGWDFNRLAKTDVAILRIAIFEINYQDLPKEIAISEAIKLAQKYSLEDSSKFINGILANV